MSGQNYYIVIVTDMDTEAVAAEILRRILAATTN